MWDDGCHRDPLSKWLVRMNQDFTVTSLHDVITGCVHTHARTHTGKREGKGKKTRMLLFRGLSHSSEKLCPSWWCWDKVGSSLHLPDEERPTSAQHPIHTHVHVMHSQSHVQTYRHTCMQTYRPHHCRFSPQPSKDSFDSFVTWGARGGGSSKLWHRVSNRWRLYYNHSSILTYWCSWRKSGCHWGLTSSRSPAVP